MKILITSGGTKVPIDSVRHIGNFSSGYNKVELNFKIWEVTKPIHYLKCGTFEFKLTDLEVDAIYNKIVDRRLEVKKASELVEMNKRFDKYGIV